MQDPAPTPDPAAAGDAATAADRPGTEDRPARRVDQALLGGEPQRVGRFEYRYDSDTWTWSDAVAIMHGYEPGQVQPTTELVLSHKHPDDLAEVEGLLKQSAAPFSSRHRIYTTTRALRTVVVVGDAATDDEGRIVATRGFYIDVTESLHAEMEQSVTEKLQHVVAHRVVIEQAKGMLMMAYQIDADAAFGILRWRSQELNVKLSAVAERVVAEVPALLKRAAPGAPVPIDHYLMTLIAPESTPR
ncbi:putative transcription antitermination regulator [Mycobacterium antarcticum]|uniref:ANTAR domain-containing protein n=1 Tax=unclassified Mycolicibacterium TaxID=2636767 RepID=UPI00238FBE37|nr:MULTISPECIES: ANTAR domain-containing protein [unclassified Mycolicibacterium]GLP78352.1 putative transcription antitermination regulator [Mycolicibacterium sp. TUM20983]GLP81402.1 putative transcription antitermination regulator [Mycolicibacterium sp. TUM20984]